ncbi:15449_t:CDS:2 [Funneliformis geosporum]|uniref:16400_t:CDS:1 n=1 Tax=Funneliformis geosporum TaxID=1117311 RepID=A0A9W4SPC6_9GLOM|nr:16400_t:CDS:2 [Funneliformis geosporum]CAI2181703.1 15449_t:CDS:2 [Funneliformis geosporum]
MIASVNCLILGEASKNNFNVVIGEVYTNDDKIDVTFDQFTISNFKELLFRREKVKKAVQDSDSMDLYKVKLSLLSLKDKIYTMDEIEDLSTMMESMLEFKEYFNNGDKKPKPRCLHIFIVPTIVAPLLEKALHLTILKRNWNELSQNHHMTEVNIRDVEKYQKQTLGQFYRKALPYDTKVDKMNLAMFGQMLEKAPMINNNKTLLDLIENDIGETNYYNVVAMVGRSGAGKTAIIVDLAKQHFIVYCQRDSVQALKDNDIRLKQRAGERVELEFLTRLLFLQLLFKIKPNLTPEQFFCEQMNGGAKTIENLVGTLRKYHVTTIRDMLSYVQRYLTKHIYDQRQGLVIALDKAHIAAKYILAEKLISPSILSENLKNQIEVLSSTLNHMNNLQEKYQRSFFTPLCATLSDMHATLVVLGTSLSLSDADQVSSAVDKKTNFQKIINFPKLNEQDVDNLLKYAIDLSECVIPPNKRRKLTGWPHFSSSVIGKLNDSDMHTKQDLFISAVDLAIDQVKNDLKKIVQNLLADKALNTARLLGHMVLAYKLYNGKISFAHISEADFVNNALCNLSKDSDDVHLIMDEPLVIEVVEEELKSINVDPEFLVYLDQFN